MPVLTLKIMPLELKLIKHGKKKRHDFLLLGPWDNGYEAQSSTDFQYRIILERSVKVEKGPKVERIIMRVYESYWDLGIMWNFLELSDPSISCSFFFVCVLTFSFHESAAWNWKHLPQLEDSAKAFAEQFFSYDLGIEAWCILVGWEQWSCKSEMNKSMLMDWNL